MILHLWGYSHIVIHFESKERLGKVCVHRLGMRHLQSCLSLSLKPQTDAVWLVICLQYFCLIAKVKQPHYRPWGFHQFEVPKFQDNLHMKVVKLSAPHTGGHYPQEIFLVLASVRCWVNPSAIVRSEGLWQWNFPGAKSGIEPATFGL
jgi:hypothetical protein